MTTPIKDSTPSIATPESDAELAKRERAKGYKAKELGWPRKTCPHDPNSLIAKWWFEGYDSDYPPGDVTPQ